MSYPHTKNRRGEWRFFSHNHIATTHYDIRMRKFSLRLLYIHHILIIFCVNLFFVTYAQIVRRILATPSLLQCAKPQLEMKQYAMKFFLCEIYSTPQEMQNP